MTSPNRQPKCSRTARVGCVLRCLLLIVLFAAPSQADDSKAEDSKLMRFAFSQPQMGVPFRIVLYAENKSTANRAAIAAFSRIAKLNKIMSDYDGESELSKLSTTSPHEKPIPVSEPLWRVFAQSQKLAAQSGGAFDVTVGPYTKLWRRARRNKKMPSEKRMSEARTAVGYQRMILDPKRKTVRLLRPKMRLDLGGIAKGYAADEALAMLRSLGIRRAMVDASGDIALGDAPPGKSGWQIAVAPLDAPKKETKKKRSENDDEKPVRHARVLSLANCAVATSGDAFQYVEIAGKRYSHIVNPHTGLGLTTPSSVTIIAKDCMTADSLASAVSVLGPEKGLEFIKSRKSVEGLIMWRNGEQTILKESTGFAQSVLDQ